MASLNGIGSVTTKKVSDFVATSRFHLPLQDGDTLTTTVGCRCAKPAACLKNSMDGVCAFVREDGICLAPPKSWKKQYAKLKEGALGNSASEFSENSINRSEL